ncbi:hypothetical protein D0Y65_007048 [Glycine soja]|nr:hypothetical protein D0Y65_007048 [Glycine soja]
MASNNHSPPLEILVKCINAKFSDDGSKLMATKSNLLISVYDRRTAKEIWAFEVPNAIAAALSPNGTYFQTFQKPLAPQEKNVTLWSIEIGATVYQQSQKNMTTPVA